VGGEDFLQDVGEGASRCLDGTAGMRSGRSRTREAKICTTASSAACETGFTSCVSSGKEGEDPDAGALCLVAIDMGTCIREPNMRRNPAGHRDHGGWGFGGAGAGVGSSTTEGRRAGKLPRTNETRESRSGRMRGCAEIAGGAASIE